MLWLLAAGCIGRAYALDTDTFRPAGSLFDGQDGFQVVTPGTGEAGSAYGGLLAVYAANPVVPVGDMTTLQPALRHEVGLRGVAGYTFGGAVRVDVDVPFYPWLGFTDDRLSGPASGDVRARGVVPLFRGKGAGEGVAVVPSLSVPTGAPDHLVGAGGVGAGVTAAAGLRPVDPLLVSGNLGLDTGPSSALGEQVFGTSLHAAAGMEWAAAAGVGLGVEVDADLRLVGGLAPNDRDPVEAHAYGTFAGSQGLVGTLGVGTALVPGVGAPDLRLVAGLAYRYGGAAPIRDVDRDGLVDGVDACPTEAEDSDGYADTDGCPDPDDDGDGILDAVDACRDRQEDRDQFEDGDGCPEPDNDRDGIPDGKDGCPEDPGLVETNGCADLDADHLEDRIDACPDRAGPRTTGGCPDRDGDGVPDDADVCPDDPASPPADGSRGDGCPSGAVLRDGRIEIREQVFFETDTATIRPESYPILADVARVLAAHPELTRVEVAGHTDSDGSDAHNQRLSQARAESVVKHLIVVGRVDPMRLVPRGYGETEPLDTNNTTQGRARNRRVEFRVVK